MGKGKLSGNSLSNKLCLQFAGLAAPTCDRMVTSGSTMSLRLEVGIRAHGGILKIPFLILGAMQVLSTASERTVSFREVCYIPENL